MRSLNAEQPRSVSRCQAASPAPQSQQCCLGVPTYLLQQVLEGSNVVCGQAEGFLVLTHHVPLKARVRGVVQLLHAEDDLPLDTDKLLSPSLLQVTSPVRSPWAPSPPPQGDLTHPPLTFSALREAKWRR